MDRWNGKPLDTCIDHFNTRILFFLVFSFFHNKFQLYLFLCVGLWRRRRRQQQCRCIMYITVATSVPSRTDTIAHLFLFILFFPNFHFTIYNCWVHLPTLRAAYTMMMMMIFDLFEFSWRVHNATFLVQRFIWAHCYPPFCRSIFFLELFRFAFGVDPRTQAGRIVVGKKVEEEK